MKKLMIGLTIVAMVLLTGCAVMRAVDQAVGTDFAERPPTIGEIAPAVQEAAGTLVGAVALGNWLLLATTLGGLVWGIVKTRQDRNKAGALSAVVRAIASVKDVHAALAAKALSESAGSGVARALSVAVNRAGANLAHLPEDGSG